MAGEQKNIDAIANVMDNGVDTFLEGVEKSQIGIFNKVLASVKGLELDVNGNVKQTVSNLRILNAVRKSVENEVLNDAYIKRVGTFTNQYPAIQSLNNDYFGSIEAAFEPNRELYNQIVSKSIQTTKASLLDSGINENVINPIVRIVDDSVTTGAMYADMVDELRTIIKGDPERLGNLLRYSKQITTDALNQFNGIYNETIASDLDLEWYYYSGGKRKTSRPFCKKYAGKYFHKKEVEDFGRKKDLDGSNLCGGSSKTDLCQGRIPGTNSSSIFRFRAGFNCRHVYKPTTIAAVPKYVIDRNIKKGYYVPDDQEQIDEMVAKYKNTETKNQKNGVYTDQRKALHNNIQNDALKGAKSAGKDKTVYMSGGATANGKSTVIDSGKIKLPKNIVKIDSDAMKAKLPEYKEMIKVNDSRAAAFAHEESSFLAKKVLRASVDKDFNALLDGTGDGSIESLSKKVAGMRANGHRVSADYVTLDTDLSLKLAKARAKKTGREVPQEFITNINRDVSIVFPQALEKNLFDDVRLWDTNINGVPRLILEQKNGITKIADQKLYDRFLAKANPNTDFSKFKDLDN